MMNGAADSRSAPSFEDHADRVLQRLRAALGDLMLALPGHIGRPHELAKNLRIDRKLAWKVFKVIQSADPFVAAQHVPGQAALQIFLRAAAKRNVSPAVIQSATDAAEELERLIRVHAGDRASFEMMSNGCAAQGSEQTDLAYRKAAFGANSYVFGVQAKAQVSLNILQPSGDSGLFDYAGVRGFVGLRRIRPNVPWVIARVRCSDSDAVVRRSFVREPIDKNAAQSPGDGVTEVPLLRTYCTEPMPQLRQFAAPDGIVEYQLVEGPVGNTGAITCLTGEVARGGGSYYRDEHNPYGEIIVPVRTPSEVLIFDQLVHEDMFGRITPSLLLYSELEGRLQYPGGGPGHNQLPVRQTIEYLGKAATTLYAPDVPRYPELVRYVFDQLGWQRERFDVYRVELRFPVIPSSVVMRHELPGAPPAKNL